MPWWFFYRLKFYSVCSLVWITEKGLKYAEHPELLLTSSVASHVLQFSSSVQDNLSQTQEKAEGLKQKKLRIQRQGLLAFLHWKVMHWLRHEWYRQKGVFFLWLFPLLLISDMAKKINMIKLEGAQRKAGRMLSRTEVHIWRGKQNGDRLILGSGVTEII